MSSRIVIIGAVIALTVAGSSAEAQAAAHDSSAILAAAIASVRPYAPSGPTAFGFADSLRVSEAQAAQIARTVGYEYGSLKAKRVCSGPSPSYCHLVGPKVFIEPTQVEINGDRAEVLVTVLDETTSRRQPIHYVWFRVFLARTGSSWQTKVQVLGET
jgi:hypothetical protein